jgi:hypothetical protein
VRSLWLMLGLAVVSCGNEAVVADAEGGASSASVSSSSATAGVGGAASTSATASSAIATSATTGSGGEGGGGGAAPVLVPRTVSVVAYGGAPEAFIDVVGHDAAGEVVDHQLTAADGVATVLAPDDGMVTLGYELVDVLPDGNGGTSTEVERALFTFAEVGSLASLDHRLRRPRQRVLNDPMTLELVTSVPSASNAWVMRSCAQGGYPIPTMGTATIEARGCDGEATFDVVILTTVGGSGVAQRVFLGLSHQPGTTTTLVIDESDLTPPPVDHVFEAPPHYLVAMMVGLDEDGTIRSSSVALGGPKPGPFEVATPPSGGVEAWLSYEAATYTLPTTSRHRILSSVPASTLWNVVPLAQPLAVTATAQPSGHPSVAWSLSNAAPGDGIEVQWRKFSTTIMARWRLFVPAGATTASFPALPTSMAALVPPGSTNIDVAVFDALAPGDGRAELFGFEYLDHERTHGDSASFP